MLELNGIDTLFCLPGVQNDSFFDALYDRTNAIRPIHARHEQACAYMALGLSHGERQALGLRGRAGPGFLNTTAALSTAYAVNAPVLALTGQIQQSMISRNVGAAARAAPTSFRSSRGSPVGDRITSPAAAPGLVNEAFPPPAVGSAAAVALECAIECGAQARSSWRTRQRSRIPARRRGRASRRAAKLLAVRNAADCRRRRRPRARVSMCLRSPRCSRRPS